MPLSTPSVTTVAEENVRLFTEDFAAATALSGWRTFAPELPRGNTATGVATWYGSPPKMQDVTDGPLNIEDAHLNDYTFTYKTFKAALRIKRTWLEDDQLGLIPPLVSALAVEAERFPGELALEILDDNPLAFDGVALVADTRSIGKSGNIDNNIGVSAGTATAPTVSEMRTALTDSRKAMAAFKDDQGRTAGVSPNLHVVPPGFADVMYAALSGNQTSGIGDQVLPRSDSNVYTVNGHTFFVNHLTSATDAMWSFRVDGNQGPIAYAPRIGAMLEMVGESSDSYVANDEIIQAVRLRGAKAVGDPRRIVKTTFS